jgi:sugar O-acyltransferase (sialic acid O-acetyltransferase NeuD family)
MTVAGIIVVGAGGHGTVVADTLLAAGHQLLGFVDNSAALHGRKVCGIPVLGDDSVLDGLDPANVQLANGLGGTKGEVLRARVQRMLEAAGWRFVTVRHPSAAVSQLANVAQGAQLMAHSVVQAGAVVGPGCIVNSAAVVEHDAQLGAFVHVGCNATLCGGVHIGADSHVGAGAVVRQGVHLGEATVVGAGAVVINDFQGGGTLLGVPARKKNTRD